MLNNFKTANFDTHTPLDSNTNGVFYFSPYISFDACVYFNVKIKAISCSDIKFDLRK